MRAHKLLRSLVALAHLKHFGMDEFSVLWLREDFLNNLEDDDEDDNLYASQRCKSPSHVPQVEFF